MFTVVFVINVVVDSVMIPADMADIVPSSSEELIEELCFPREKSRDMSGLRRRWGHRDPTALAF